MVSSRHAPRGAATPPATLLATLPITQTPASVSSSSSSAPSKKMSREMQRLMIDANPSLGGSSPGTSRRSRTSNIDMTVPPSPPPSQTTSSPAKDSTDSAATSPKKLSLPDPSATLAAQDDANMPRLPSPAADKPVAQTFISVTADLPPTHRLTTATQSPTKRTTTPKTARGVKRTIHDYFGTSVKSPAEAPAKRQKLEAPVKTEPWQPVEDAQQPFTATANAQDTAALEMQEAEQDTTQHDPVPAMPVPPALSEPTPEPAPEPAAEPVNAQPAHQHITNHDREIDLAAPSPEQVPTENTTTQQPQSAPILSANQQSRFSREMRNLEIAANAAILGSTSRNTKSRRATSSTAAASSLNLTHPPAPPKRAFVPRTSTSSNVTTTATPAIDPLTLVPKPFPLADPLVNRARPRLLSSGHVNPVWLDGLLAYIADITGDDDTRDVLLAEAAVDVPAQSEAQRTNRLLDDAKVLRDWPLLTVEETARVKGPREAVGMA